MEARTGKYQSGPLQPVFPLPCFPHQHRIEIISSDITMCRKSTAHCRVPTHFCGSRGIILSNKMSTVINTIRKEIWINPYIEKDRFQNSFPVSFYCQNFLFRASVVTHGKGEFICILYPVLIFRETFYKLIIPSLQT